MALDPNYQFVHCTSLDFGKDGYAMIINEKNVDTGESRLKIIKNPIRPFWITRPNARTHKEKKEFAKVSELEMFQCPQNQLKEELAKKLGIYKGPNAWYDMRKMCDNPYVYGADIDPEVIYRIGYMKKCRPVKDYNVGFLDIETSVFGDEQVNVMTYIDQHFCIHTGVLKLFLKEKGMKDILEYKDSVWFNVMAGLNDEAKKAVANLTLNVDVLTDEFKEEHRKWMKDKVPLKDLNPAFIQLINENLAKLFTFDIRIFDKELDLLVWSMRNIHDTKPDFVGIWNMDYDIPYLIKRFQIHGINPATAFSHPEVPPKFRMLRYKQDKGKDGQHFTEKWHWLYCPGYTKYIDSMCLYSRIRKVDGKENSYKLDFIANKEIGIGKMPVTTHEDMQENHFVEYVIYNMVDAAVMSLMEIINHDMTSMVGLSYISPLPEFAHQTKQLTNNFYEYCREKGLVPAAVGGSQRKPTDAQIFNVGGAVLDPTNIRDASLPVMMENDDMTQLYCMVCDIDVSSMYPSTMIAFNVAKQTKLATVLGIEGFEVLFDKPETAKDRKVIFDPVNEFYTHISAVSENAIFLGEKYFNLVSYEEALRLYKEYKDGQH